MAPNEELKQKISDEKAKSGTLILAHVYQSPEILDIADEKGDSYALAVAAARHNAKRILLCGVRFMAETVKILSPGSEVVLARSEAGCPMAEQISPERVHEFKEQNPGIPVIAYVNTTAELKALCDVCVTSSTAVKIIKSMPQNELLFIPDKNLGAYVQGKAPEKKLILWDGCCPVHQSVTPQDVLRAKKEHPRAKLAAHPECGPEVLKLADMTGATSEIIDYALSDEVDGEAGIIVGTERGVADYLSIKHPNRSFYQLAADKLVCPDMRMTGLEDVYLALTGQAGEIITLDEKVRLAAKKSLDNMILYASK